MMLFSPPNSGWGDSPCASGVCNLSISPHPLILAASWVTVLSITYADAMVTHLIHLEAYAGTNPCGSVNSSAKP